MNSEVEVPETPNWLQELEAKRERRLKAKLGHEAGAGAPCLKCGDKCPGLDLHFWRKCCKICRCSKEEHEVQDDDIYGWAQFQLLGSKPSKIKRKIVLPGKKDELELDWAPKGNTDVVDKYLKTLPSEQLPVKGSQAAKDRKQQLQKQIPVHDIDPTLCHELTEDELNKMNEYIAHVKNSSVGIGQIVNLSSIIKGNLHMLNPNEAALIASRYPKGIPLSEVVKLHPAGRVDPLKHHDLVQNMQNVHIKEKNMTNLSPNKLISREETMSPITVSKIHDINYAGYTDEMTKSPQHPQYSRNFNKSPNMLNNLLSDNANLNNYPSAFVGQKYNPTKTNTENYNNINDDPNLNEKFMPNVNFNPKNLPSQFINQHMPVRPNVPGQQHNVQPYGSDVPYSDINSTGSAFVPYSKTNTGGVTIGSQMSKDIPNSRPSGSTGLSSHDQFVNHPHLSEGVPEEDWEKTNELRKGPHNLPNYMPGKLNQVSEMQAPINVPRNFKDLAFSTYDSEHDPNPEDNERTGDSEIRQGTPSKIHGQDNWKNNPNWAVPGSYLQNDPRYLGANYKPYHTKGVSDNRGELDKDITHDQDSSDPNSELSGGYPQKDPRYPPGSNYKPYHTKGISDPRNHEGELGNEIIHGQDSWHNDPNSELSGRYLQNDPRYPPGYNYNPFDIKSISDTRNPENIGGKHGSKTTQGTPSKFHGQDNWENDPNSVLPGNYPQSDPSYPPGYNYNPFDIKSISDNRNPENYRGNLGNEIGQGTPSKFRGQDNWQNDPNATLPGSYPQNNPRFSPGSNYKSDHTKDDSYPTNAEINGGKLEGTPSNFHGQDNRQNDPNSMLPGNYPQSDPRYSPGSNYSPLQSTGLGHQDKKKLTNVQPGNFSVTEDFLEPSQVSIGAIQDINYPEIKAAIQGTNDFYEDYSPESIKEILNNFKLPDCHYCKKPFEEKEFAVTIERANVLFHAHCFKCAGCNQNLADNVYFYSKESNNVYCGRDYAKIRGIPRCKACDELIFTKEYCLAEDNTFHLKHFCCTECDTPLAGQDYIVDDDDGMPYCLPCFERSKADSCNSCGRIIKPDEMGCNLNGVHFHADDQCFACKVCHKPLIGKKLLLRNKALFCSHECYGTTQ